MKKHMAKFATVGLVLALVLCLAGSASAGSIPAGWTCVGNCGQSGASGVVPLSPYGSSQYQWVSTEGGPGGGGSIGALGGTNGSALSTSVFSANAGDKLDFFFNYVTSDGAGFADYGWAALMNTDNTVAALIFTARTTPGGNTVPGFGMPALDPNTVLVPPSTVIHPGGPVWGPLGGSSGACYNTGCGYTGWIEAKYTIQNPGNYYLKIGAANWLDTAYDSGLAMDGIKVAGNPILPPTGAPEPGTLVLLCGGFLPFVGRLLRRR